MAASAGLSGSPPFARTGTGTTHLPSSFSRRTCVGRSTVHGTVHSSSCLPLHPLSSRWIQMEAGGNCAVVYSTLPRSSRSCAEGTLPGNYQVGRSHPVPEQSCSRARARIICQPSQAQRLSTGTNTLLSIPSDQTRDAHQHPTEPRVSPLPRGVGQAPGRLIHAVANPAQCAPQWVSRSCRCAQQSASVLPLWTGRCRTDKGPKSRSCATSPESATKEKHARSTSHAAFIHLLSAR